MTMKGWLQMKATCIALDLDGTLLTDKHIINEKTKLVLKELNQAGIHIVLATGRSPLSCYEIMKDLGLHGPVIAYNGGIIVDSQSKEIFQGYHFDVKEIYPFVQLARNKQLDFHVSTATAILVENHSMIVSDERYKGRYIEAFRVGDVLEIKENIYKMCIIGDVDTMDELETQLPFINTKLNFTRSAIDTIDIIHPNVNKGFALRKLANQLGISMSEVVAFGNYYNDIEMLQAAGIGVAMANAPIEIQMLADRVTSSNNEDGVAKMLDKLFVTKC